MKKKFEVTGNNLVFEFPSPSAAQHFKTWLCEQGEQDYWGWMEFREQEESGDITAIRFDYHNGSTIKASCGRMDRT